MLDVAPIGRGASRLRPRAGRLRSRAQGAGGEMAHEARRRANTIAPELRLPLVPGGGA